MSWEVFDRMVGKVRTFLTALGLITTILAGLVYFLYFRG